MKTLMKIDNDGNPRYQRVEDKTPRDLASIQGKVKSGWNFCSKDGYRNGRRQSADK